MATAAAAAKNKIVRAYTAKDIESDSLECVLINQLNRDIYSIDDGDLSDKITIPELIYTIHGRRVLNWRVHSRNIQPP